MVEWVSRWFLDWFGVWAGRCVGSSGCCDLMCWYNMYFCDFSGCLGV